MKILFLTSYDATNFRLVNIVKAFIQDGHEVLIYPVVNDESNIRMFRNIKELNWVSVIDDNVIDGVDVIFCGNDTVWKVSNYNKYIFSYSVLTLGNAISEGADFMFISGETQRYDYREMCPFMKIGNPMYDDYVDSKKNTRNFLFIDSGHYPFGKKGKEILAKLILDICYKFPEYTLTIKPRFLVSDKEYTHVNRNHLYTNIVRQAGGHLPSNLVMLNQHYPMKYLIENCDTVMCMYTSAYLDAAVLNKGLIIIDGLPNENSYDLNNEFHWERARKTLEETGCLVNYRDVLNFLPDGIICSEKHLMKELKYRRNVAERIVEVVKYIYNKFISKGKYIQVKEYNYENYSHKLIEQEYLNFNEVMANRIYNKCIFRLCRRRDCIDHQINIDHIIERLLYLKKEGCLNEKNVFGIDQYIDDTIDELLIKNKDILLSDDIKASYVLPVLFKKNMENTISIINKLPYEMRGTIYFKARYMELNNYYNNAEECYTEFLKQVNESDYVRYSTDTHYFVSSALFHLAMCMYKLGKYEEAYHMFEKCNEYENYNHRAAQNMICKIILHKDIENKVE